MVNLIPFYIIIVIIINSSATCDAVFPHQDALNRYLFWANFSCSWLSPGVVGHHFYFCFGNFNKLRDLCFFFCLKFAKLTKQSTFSGIYTTTLSLILSHSSFFLSLPGSTWRSAWTAGICFQTNDASKFLVVAFQPKKKTSVKNARFSEVDDFSRNRRGKMVCLAWKRLGRINALRMSHLSKQYFQLLFRVTFVKRFFVSPLLRFNFSRKAYWTKWKKKSKHSTKLMIF